MPAPGLDLSPLVVTALESPAVTIDAGQLAMEHATVAMLRRSLGTHLATYRRAAGLSQPQLAQVLGRTRSTLSKIEHGTRTMPAALWKIADDLCHAHGALISEHDTLQAAHRGYRDRCRAHDRQIQQAAAQAQVDALAASPAPVSAACLNPALMHGELAEELLQVVTRLVRSLGRRDAMQIVGWALASVGLSGVDPTSTRG
jgi:transcriptional regulator with XRE-family HTH domain